VGRNMRIGVLGGSFDPVHLGHLLLAEQARQELELEKVIFIPSFLAPFKKENAPALCRYKMVCLAIKRNPYFEVSFLEIKRKGVSYSIDTIRELKKVYDREEMFFILGSDAWNHFSSWKEKDKLLQLVRFAVIERPGFPLKEQGAQKIEGEVFPISSSQIREKVKRGESIRYLVPEAVRRYILNKGL